MGKARSDSTIAYIDSVLAQLTKEAPRAIREGNVSAVHNARVATRRLGAALGMLNPLISDYDRRLITKALKKIRQSVQDLRDMDVMQEHLAERAKKVKEAVSCKTLTDLLVTHRQETFAKVSADARVEKWLSRVGHWMAVRGQLLVKKGEVKELVLRELDSQFHEFAAQADRLSEALLAPTIQHHDVEPHALRIAGKSLRYTFEMAQAERLDVSNKTLRTYKKLQDALGLWHDYYVLSMRILDYCHSRMESPHYHQDGDSLLQVAITVVRDSRLQLRKFAVLWQQHRPALLEQLDRIGVSIVRVNEKPERMTAISPEISAVPIEPAP